MENRQGSALTTRGENGPQPVNGLIEQFQGNRNPYVDDYTLADKVGASVFKSH